MSGTTRSAGGAARQFVPRLEENMSVKIVGLGGVGGITARYLAMYLASLDIPMRLVLIDGDAFEPSNATRMFFSEPGNKAEVTRAALLPRFRDTGLCLASIPEFVTPENIERLVHSGDIVLSAVDNHATRRLLSDFCGGLDDVCLISGGNDGVGADSQGRPTRGTYGNCQIYRRRGGVDCSPSLTRFHPEIREPADRSPAEPSCTDILPSVPQILFANLAAASAILNAFWLHACGTLPYSELAFDIAEGLMRPVLMAGPERDGDQETTTAREMAMDRG